VSTNSSSRHRGTASRGVLAGSALLLAASLAACTSAAPDQTDPSPTSTVTGPTPVPSETGPAPVVPSPPAPSTYSGPPPATASVVGATTLPPVQQGEAAAFGDGLVATVTGVEQAEATGTDPGDVAGPATAVRIRLENGTDAPVDLGGVTVTATHGADAEPAPSLTGPPSAPAQGVLAPGEDAEGVWAFSVPTSGASSLVLTITSVSSASVVVVRV